MGSTKIELRCFQLTDVPKVFQMSKEKSLIHFLPDQEYADLEEAEEVLSYLMAQYSENERIEKFPFVLGIERTSSDELIGHIGVSQVKEGIELGYAIEETYQGMGYASLAVEKMCQKIAADSTLSDIYGIVDPENKASIRVLEKSGFVKATQAKDKLYYQLQIVR